MPVRTIDAIILEILTPEADHRTLPPGEYSYRIRAYPDGVPSFEVSGVRVAPQNVQDFSDPGGSGAVNGVPHKVGRFVHVVEVTNGGSRTFYLKDREDYAVGC